MTNARLQAQYLLDKITTSCKTLSVLDIHNTNMYAAACV